MWLFQRELETSRAFSSVPPSLPFSHFYIPHFWVLEDFLTNVKFGVAGTGKWRGEGGALRERTVSKH